WDGGRVRSPSGPSALNSRPHRKAGRLGDATLPCPTELEVLLVANHWLPPPGMQGLRQTNLLLLKEFLDIRPCRIRFCCADPRGDNGGGRISKSHQRSQAISVDRGEVGDGVSSQLRESGTHKAA